MSKIDDEITELEKKIKDLQLKKLRLESLSPDKKIAETLHLIFCRANHTDGCGWYYEDWENYETGYSKKRHVEAARKLLKYAEEQTLTIEELINFLEFIQENHP